MGTVTLALDPDGMVIVWLGLVMLTIPETAVTLAMTVMSVTDELVMVRGNSAESARTVKSLPRENETNSSYV